MSKRKPYVAPDVAASPTQYWSSLEDLNSTPQRAIELHNQQETEFTPGASEWVDPVSRRSFMSIMGAGVALATMEGCRRPVENILPYTRLPETVIPGIPTHYATVWERNGDAIGLIVESHEGRPTKIEGNPDHPGSVGGTDMATQASVLDLYDPDRAKHPSHGGVESTLGHFDDWFAGILRAHEADGGRALRVLAEPTISPTFIRLRGLVQRRFPNAHFHTYDSQVTSSTREGTRLAFGAPVNPIHAFDHAAVIVSLDADFLQTERGMVRNTRAFADGRRLNGPGDSMSRLYQIESWMSTTGANADHRLRLPSRDVEAFALALAAKLVSDHGVDLGEIGATLTGRTPPLGAPAEWIDQLARDLAQNRNNSVIVAGERQPPNLHALVAALNHALGSVGHTMVYASVADADEPEQSADLRGLTDAMAAGQVQTLVMLGGNPVYDAPGDLDFASKLSHVANTVHLAIRRDETSEHATWHVQRAHYLETWGDAQSLDGTIAVQQPLITPLYFGRSDIELLAQLAASPSTRGYDVVQDTVRGEAPMTDARSFTHAWRSALHLGVMHRSTPVPMTTLVPRLADIATQIHGRAPGAAIGRGNIEAVFVPDPKLRDGRHANNAWLVELPDPLTRIVWDNAAMISPATAHELGIDSGDIVQLRKDGRSIRIAAWILPGQADYSIALPLGWGRTAAGRIGNGKGFDVNPLRSSQSMHFVDGVEVTKTGETYRLVQTQEHHRMVGRPIALDASIEEYREHPRFAEHRSPTPRTLPLWRGVEYNGHKWGMSIDLNACTGCNACAVACQSENNVPVVGKDQVHRGREMHWLRVDRYFTGSEHDPGVVSQPVMCVQCENAPCENVCPVNATQHSPEGLNDMAYNRCVGTRYCSNNCPYKVRRFNYLNFSNDGPYQPQDSSVPETVRMQRNPNVTVRFRGVMEKCTYCVQRIQSAKIAGKRENRPLHDGEIVTACQQACPAHAIVFGDLNDDRSRVAALARNDRGYHLLGEIGTRPRTTHLARIRNENPQMPARPERNAERHG